MSRNKRGNEIVLLVCLNASSVKVKPSFAAMVNEQPAKKVVKIQEMRNDLKVEGAAVILPIEAVEAVNARFCNTLYGYFIGSRLAFPLVENYVKNTWAKYGLKQIQLHEEFFLFQFNSREGMENVLENGPWSTYARALIEISAEDALKESLVIAIPSSDNEGHSLATIEIEYEWTPPRCSTCKIFDHVNDKCPKLPKVVPNVDVTNDGFTEVRHLNRKRNRVQMLRRSILVDSSKNMLDTTKVTTTNAFSALSMEDDDKETNVEENQFVNDSDSEVDEYISLEEAVKTDPLKTNNDVQLEWLCCTKLSFKIAMSLLGDFNDLYCLDESSIGPVFTDTISRV
ncbi:retrovirus-related pol polyprotein from transposon 17.6 [Tanacetum coccineum]